MTKTHNSLMLPIVAHHSDNLSVSLPLLDQANSIPVAHLTSVIKSPHVQTPNKVLSILVHVKGL